MMVFFWGVMMSAAISAIMVIISVVVGKVEMVSISKNSSYECGFYSMDSARIPFSLRFFLLVVVFLIFDVEVVLLFPLLSILGSGKMNLSIFICGVVFLLILLFGLIHEWNEGSLNWMN
uniref:NADH-ubiquinone oxidoreductase chain 3 n=1 Tax=Tropidomya abbreviata TaxID=102404 RepID=A0A1U9XPK2_9BIVA|nr:NADH dehydrogenase subunit 3 [Tropidomya abbreviata]AQZ26180.1 NADH dehydrogenase subunit 3 [Tropidomya abbreviata]